MGQEEINVIVGIQQLIEENNRLLGRIFERLEAMDCRLIQTVMLLDKLDKRDYERWCKEKVGGKIG